MPQIQIRDRHGNGIPLINIRISEGEKSSDEAIFDVFTDYAGNTGWPIPFWPAQRYALHVNFSNVNQRYVAQSYYLLASDVDTVRIELADFQRPQPIYPFPAEAGRWHIQGRTFRTENGQLGQWRGFSWFLGFLRFCRGEDITPDLRWMRANGFNIPRVFGPLPWAETPDYRVEHFDLGKFDVFLALLEDHGLRCNFSIAHYVGPDWRHVVQGVFDVASRHWNTVIEMVNEPHVGEKPDPYELLEGIDRHGVLTSYGYYGTFYQKTNPGMPLALDFVTMHTSRDDAWHRKARHTQEVAHALNKPCISDEPAKAIEHHFNYPGGKRDPNEFVWHHTVCALWTPGSTLHTEEGKWGRVPTDDMLQGEIVRAVRDNVWLRIGPEWQTGEYVGAHLSRSPVDGKDLQINGEDIWTYSSLHADKALAVRVALSDPRAKPGWQDVERWGPAGSIVRLVR